MAGANDTIRALPTLTSVEVLLRDIRYALRQAYRNPGFATIAVLTLALCIGANTAFFSLVDAVLLNPLPYPGASRMVYVWESLPRLKMKYMGVSWPDFFDWRNQNRVFDAMAAVGRHRITLTGMGAPVVMWAASVSRSFFELMGVRPSLGRTFTALECKPGGSRVAVVSHSFWQNYLHAVGRLITLNGWPAMVIGVLPPGFKFPGLHFGVYLPLGLESNVPAMVVRADHPLEVFAKLRPGVSLTQVQANMDTIMDRLGRQYPRWDRNERAILTPMRAFLTGGVRHQLILMLGAVACVLMLGCTNLASMLLGRATVRRHEFAVRAALGADWWHLVRQLLVESAILSALGGVAGLFVADLTITPFVRLYPHRDRAFGLNNAHRDPRVLLFTFVITAAATVLCGLAPAVSAARTDPKAWLSGVAGGNTRATPRLRSALIVFEIAIALVLAIGTGLLLRTLVVIGNVNPGFRADHLLVLDVPETRLGANPQHSVAFFRSVLMGVNHLPGVISASGAMELPLGGPPWISPYVPFGQPSAGNTQEPWTAINPILPGYFRTMKTRLIAGRFFSDSARADSTPVAIINQVLARRLAPRGNAIGRRIYVRYCPHPVLQIVGVVADMKQFSLTRPDMPEVYVSEAQVPISSMTIVVRTSVDPQSIAHSAVAVIHQIDYERPVTHVTTMASVIASSTADRRFLASLLGLFGILGFVLAGVGIFGVTSYGVAQRTHEIGVRMALGAQERSIRWMVVRQGISLALLGVAGGIVGAFVLTRFLSGFLYGVKPIDAFTFVAVSLLLTGVALLACYVPARRAAKVDPVVALRHE